MNKTISNILPIPNAQATNTVVSQCGERMFWNHSAMQPLIKIPNDAGEKHTNHIISSRYYEYQSVHWNLCGNCIKSSEIKMKPLTNCGNRFGQDLFGILPTALLIDQFIY